LIKDRVSLGIENESILREFLKSYVPKHYSIGHGFIFKNHKEVSRQCDIIIYDSSFFSPIFKQGDFVVVPPESVMSVIEVKTEISSGNFLDAAIDNITSVRTLNNRISGIIFAYRGTGPIKIINSLTEYYQNNRISSKEVFELLVVLNKSYSIIPKRVDNAEALFNLDSTINNIEADFVFHALDTGDKTFYIFFYYILRQIRSYIFNAFISSKNKRFCEEFSKIPMVPRNGLHTRGYFDVRQDDIKKLGGNLKFDDKGNFLGVLLGKDSE
jgi:hypothetical protein